MTTSSHATDETPQGEWSIGAMLHRDCEGSAMTEFIVTLPLFMLIFSGILQLTYLQSTSVQVKIASLQDLWNRSVEVQRGDLDTHPDPPPNMRYDVPDQAEQSTEIVRDRDRWGTNDELDYSDNVDDAKFDALGRRGTIGESNAALNRAGPQSDALNSKVTIDAHGGSVEGNIEDVSGPLDDPENETARRLFEDSQSADFGNTGLSQKFSRTQGASGNNQPAAAVGAGARYGLISAETSRTVQIAGMSVELSGGYDTLAPPVSLSSADEAKQTVGAARRTLEADDRFHELLGIDFTDQLD